MIEPYQFLSPELQRLVQEPLSEPPARAREHWKALREAMERLDGLRTQQAAFDADIAPAKRSPRPCLRTRSAVCEGSFDWRAFLAAQR
jgi:hypothetical protein